MTTYLSGCLASLCRYIAIALSQAPWLWCHGTCVFAIASSWGRDYHTIALALLVVSI